jgi:hypothetical protein
MAHRNRWFTELKNGGSFHGELLNNQMVPTYWDIDKLSIYQLNFLLGIIFGYIFTI